METPRHPPPSLDSTDVLFIVGVGLFVAGLIAVTLGLALGGYLAL